jgi:integrase
MAKLTTATISKRTVEALAVGKDTVYWDSELSGFGVRAYPSGSKYYVVQTRANGKAAKRVTVGRHGVITAEEARRRAALIVSRIKAGEEAIPEPMAAKLAEGPTVGDLAEAYLEKHVAVRCKPKTESMYRLVVAKYIVPELGKRPALAVDHGEVTRLHHSLSAKPVMANHVVDILSRIYNAAEDRGDVPEASNPCRLVVKNRERRRERFLTDGEFRRLGRVLDEAETCKGVSTHAIAAIRLLLLTGCRKGEVLALRWADVDLDAGELRLPDAKSGPRAVQLPPPAVRLLEDMPRRAGSPWVFPGRDRNGRYGAGGLDKAWHAVRVAARLEDVRIHDLRHSFASRALALGETLPVIGKLLGHNDIETTARYAHLAQDSVHEAAERIAGSIAADIL